MRKDEENERVEDKEEFSKSKEVFGNVEEEGVAVIIPEDVVFGGLDWLRELRVMRVLSGEYEVVSDGFDDMKGWLDENLENWELVREKIVSSGLKFYEVLELRRWLGKYMPLNSINNVGFIGGIW
ncbi:MAG: hypothetical protein J7L07_02740 [Candidatus Odinarchaeota archaeon]|nr:hypothetical protein [Candidatus Odinarchaeota archaeon]